MLTRAFDDLARKAKKLGKMLKNIGDTRLTISQIDISSKVGGGALPLLDLPSKGVGVEIKGMTSNSLEKFMRSNDIPIIGRIEEDIFIMDVRTIQSDEFTLIKSAIQKVLNYDR